MTDQTARGLASLLGSSSSASRLGEPGRAWASRAMTDQTARGSAIHAQSSPIHAPSDLTFTLLRPTPPRGIRRARLPRRYLILFAVSSTRLCPGRN